MYTFQFFKLQDAEIISQQIKKVTLGQLSTESNIREKYLNYMVDFCVKLINDKSLTVEIYKNRVIRHFQTVINLVQLGSTDLEREKALKYINVQVDKFAATKAEEAAKKASPAYIAAKEAIKLEKLKEKLARQNKKKYLKYKIKYLNYKNQVV